MFNIQFSSFRTKTHPKLINSKPRLKEIIQINKTITYSPYQNNYTRDCAGKPDKTYTRVTHNKLHLPLLINIPNNLFLSKQGSNSNHEFIQKTLCARGHGHLWQEATRHKRCLLKSTCSGVHVSHLDVQALGDQLLI